MLCILFASKNRHKVLEASKALEPYGIEVVPTEVKKLEIQSDSIEEIAIYAVKHAYRELRKPIVVEDAGLFIEALKGFPGPYSSYVFKTIGIEGILKLMKDVADRRAKFISVVAIALSEYEVYVFKGVVEGRIAEEARGSKGFGFDPIFIPLGYDRTFAEMNVEEKTAVSHRGKAFRALAKWILENRDKLIPLLLKCCREV